MTSEIYKQHADQYDISVCLCAHGVSICVCNAAPRSHFDLLWWQFVPPGFFFGLGAGMAEPEQPDLPKMPRRLKPSQKDVVEELQRKLSKNDALKCQVLELKDFIVWKGAKKVDGKGRRAMNCRMVCANMCLMETCMPSISSWDGVTQVDVMHWILMSVLGSWKAREVKTITILYNVPTVQLPSYFFNVANMKSKKCGSNWVWFRVCDLFLVIP